MTPENIQELFERLSAQNPNPQTELYYTNHYTLLVAVILSAQATDVGVNKATKDLFATVDNPQKMIEMGIEELIRHIKTIGLYPSKANNIMAMSQILMDQFQGQIPRTRESLESLPGVGRKTANVVLNIAFQEATIPVDTHIFRVANRLKLASGKTPRNVEKGLESVIPERFRLHAHNWLILHGRYVCKARVPLCSTCILNDLCLYEHKSLPHSKKSMISC